MAKKRRGRKMPAWRKAAKAAVGIAGKALGVTVALGPAIEVVRAQMGSPERIPKEALFAYTGVNVDTGAVVWQKTIAGVGSVVGGIVIMKLFSYLSRSV